jgi:hypothetical protein
MSINRIDAVAREIKNYYIERKQSIYNGKFKMPPKFADFSTWQSAASICVELNATPETFVDAAFSYCPSSAGPYPNTLHGPAIRKWYSSYIKGRQDLYSSAEKSSSGGRDVMFDPQASPCVADLSCSIEYVNRSLTRLLGSAEITEQAIEYLGSLMVSYPAHVRVLLAFKNEKVKKFFGKEAYDFYTKNPGMYRAAETLNYPIREILLWLNAPTH